MLWGLPLSYTCPIALDNEAVSEPSGDIKFLGHPRSSTPYTIRKVSALVNQQQLGNFN